MNMQDYNTGLEEGLKDGRSGILQLDSALRYIDNEGLDIDKDSFSNGYITGLANVNSTC